MIFSPAVRLKSNPAIILIAPNHGHYILNDQKMDLDLDTRNSFEKGFVTNNGEFVDRANAYKIAKQNDQLLYDCFAQELYSDNFIFNQDLYAYAISWQKDFQKNTILGISYDFIFQLLANCGLTDIEFYDKYIVKLDENKHLVLEKDLS